MCKYFFDYFLSLARLSHGRQAINVYLDTPLSDATIRSRIASVWAALFSLIGYTTYRYNMDIPARLSKLPMVPRVVLFVLLFIAIWLCLSVAGYGFLRLFTLVSHNLTTNLLKVRGQRLRLLNVYTTLLSLFAPMCLGLGISHWNSDLGFILLAALGVYALVLLTFGYNVIFHKQGWQGFRLVVLGLSVTAFVLAIGALAIGVAAAVVAFLVVVVLRPFLHH